MYVCIAELELHVRGQLAACFVLEKGVTRVVKSPEYVRNFLKQQELAAVVAPRAVSAVTPVCPRFGPEVIPWGT
jgi:hypothetical protein